jgi:hypothetical protein
MTTEKQLKTCNKGHQFYKSSDCPACPFCDRENKPTEGFLSLLGSPARNSLMYHGIPTLEVLSKYTEKEILSLHGIGPVSLPTLRKALAEAGLSFRK